MKKAGIITLFGEYNFGNRLQNYAVQEVLKKKGLDVQTIKYMPKDTKPPETNDTLAKERLQKFRKFNEKINFAKETLYSDVETPNNFGEEYDYIILGGDQIWNHTFTKSFSDKAIRLICSNT